MFLLPPSDVGESAVTNYSLRVALFNGTTVKMYQTGPISPVLVTELANDVSYLVTIAAVNTIGAFVSRDPFVLPAAPMAWTYSTFSGCTVKCGTGSRSRTARCQYNSTVPALAAVALPDSKCTAAELNQQTTAELCNTQACPAALLAPTGRPDICLIGSWPSLSFRAAGTLRASVPYRAFEAGPLAQTAVGLTR